MLKSCMLQWIQLLYWTCGNSLLRTRHHPLWSIQ